MNQTVLQENPYAAPVAAVADQAPPALVLADRGTRLAAYLLDGLIGLVAFVPFVLVLPFVSTIGERNYDVAFGIAAGLCFFLLLGLTVWNCILLSRGGQTLAKRLLGIRIVRRDGSHCGLLRIIFARYLPVVVLGAVPFFGSLVTLADALLIFRDSCRCLHDEIADTIVVKA